MNTSTLAIGTLLAAIAAGSLTAMAMPPSARAAADPLAETSLVAALERLEPTLARLEAVTQAVAALGQRTAARPAAARSEIGSFAREIEAYLDARGTDPAAMATAVPADAWTERETTAAIRELEAVGDNAQAQLIWRKLYQEGHAYAVLEEMGLRAEATPGDPTAFTNLGLANLWLLFQAQSTGDTVRFREGADEAFLRALDIDDQDWGARFARAIMLTNVPAVLGRTNEAIAEFQTLLAQQANMQPVPQHADTYLYLGNMYEQTGQTEKAIAAWREGNRRFPDNETLAQHVQQSVR